MKTDLPCAIVRDLLPSYVEGLTEEETTAAVKNHLESCSDCRSRYEAMTCGEPASDSEEKEVDYLKTVRRKNWKKVILAVVTAVVIILGGVFVQLFFIGSPIEDGGMAMDVKAFPEKNKVSVSFINTNSAMLPAHVKVETVGDTVFITGRQVLVSPFYDLLSSDASSTIEVDTGDISRIEVFGMTVWQNGVEIYYHTNRLMSYKTPFVGNPSAVNALISNMDLDAGHTLELQTAREPYGATIHFTDSIEEDRRFMVEGNAAVLLALVDNLGEVYWDDPRGYADSLTMEEINRTLAEKTEQYNEAHGTDYKALGSIKEYGRDASQLQILRNILGI